MIIRWLPVVLLGAVGSVFAQDDEFTSDPYLDYRPPFARSLPVQIMLTGVVLTLVAVLFIHLMFTAQYHWPLAPVNYVLQLSGVTTLLISLIATIHVVLSATFAESEKWPYMLSYIAVNVPPSDLETNVEWSKNQWSIAERATWLVMNASTSGLIQITHIQFLTLLYPSRLEGRLIFALLGPLAIVAAVMQLLPINGSASVNLVASAVRNVCNATLSLLFTVALFIWGLLVNRQQAWRTDGGTAVFGCAALALAVVSTALNLIYVHREEEFVWLPSLMWAVVLWQSFLGWWWWVGAGSGGGFSNEDEDMEEKMRREAKRESRRREAREKRRETKIRAQRVWKGVAGAFSANGQPSPTDHAEEEGELRSRTRRNRRNSTDGDADPDQENAPATSPTLSERDDTASVLSRVSDVTLTTSYTGITRGTLPRMLPNVVHRWYASLRREHNAAARLQAAERVERIREIGRGREGRSSDLDRRDARRRDGRPARDDREDGWGWGWGWDGLGWSRRENRSGSRSRSRHHDEDDDQEIREVRRRRQVRDDEDDEDDMYASEEDEHEEEEERRRRSHRRSRRRDEEEEENIREKSPHSPPPVPSLANTRSRSIWWWGPLSRWRLKDSTTY